MKKNKLILITIVFCATIIFIVAMTSAKYAYNSVWNYYLRSRGFYFKSDALEVGNKKNSVLTWNGSDIFFTLSNNENDSLVSEYDISYDISCEILGYEKEYLDCVLNGSGKSSATGVLSSVSKCVDNKEFTDVKSLTKSECELSGYNWVNEISVKENYFNVVLKDATKNIDEVSVQVVAETTSPYKKVLKGIFNLNLVENETVFSLDFQNYSDYDELTIINKTSEDRCFFVAFDAQKYIVNEYDSIISYDSADSDKINKIKVEVDKINSTAIKFYKIKEEIEYSVEDFIIEENEC